MQKVIHGIEEYAGVYSGRGRNHEGESFVCEFELQALAEVSGVQIKFRATSTDGSAVFHAEYSLIAMGRDGVSLFNLNSNNPTVCEHKLVHEALAAEGSEVVFRYGEIENRHSFREEIRLSLMSGGRVGYEYSWGLPGGEFARRSGVIMDRK